MKVRLSELVEQLGECQFHHFKECLIEHLAYRPDQVMPGCVFVCMDEFLHYNQWLTWRSYLEELPKLDLGAVISPERIDGLEIPQIVVKNPRQALGIIAKNLHPEPHERLKLIGITGTNGKTTTSRLTAELMSNAEHPFASLGTLGLWMNGRNLDAGHYTTPLGRELNMAFAKVSETGGSGVALEVSSHALALDRVEGVRFDVAVLTNLERDHLDFHGTETAYAEAKLGLFCKLKPDGFSVLNKKSQKFSQFEKVARSSGKVITYGVGLPNADLNAEIKKVGASGTEFQVHWEGETGVVSSSMVGIFQVENLLASLSVWLGFGKPFLEGIEKISKFRSVSGRMERWDLPGGATALIDYAHNPDGLKNLLLSCKAIGAKRLLLVFGCGGDRDRGKRPMMGALAAETADKIWITSDNPRTEEPEKIIQEILAGCGNRTKELVCQIDRERAIREAIADSGMGDLVIIAGKGHEDYQIIGHEKRAYSDQAVVLSCGGLRA